MQVIQVYAPTSSHPDDEIEDFYETLTNTHMQENCHFKIIMGDFNAKVSKSRESPTVGTHGSKQGNDRGDGLMEFAECTKMYKINSFYKKKAGRKWTWRSPNGVKNEIDFFLSNNKSIFRVASALNQFNTGSDHRIVKARIVFNFRLESETI